MMKPYIIEARPDVNALAEAVNTRIAQGYVPTGGVSVTRGWNKYGDTEPFHYLQAMVLSEKPSKLASDAISTNPRDFY